MHACLPTCYTAHVQDFWDELISLYTSAPLTGMGGIAGGLRSKEAKALRTVVLLVCSCVVDLLVSFGCMV